MKDVNQIVSIKQDAKLIYEAFEKKYKKVSKGITDIYLELMMSNNLKKIEKLYMRFYGYIVKSRNAKERFK